MPGSWGVVIPVKRLSLAKSRLSSYGAAVREELAMAMAADVVTAALACPVIAEVLVVTDDERAAAVLRGLGARVEGDDPDDGLNPALAHGAELLRASAPGRGVATLSSDLPALRATDLTSVLGEVVPGQRAFVPDADGSGTTLLAAGPGTALGPAFGPGSRAQHLASGAVELAGTEQLRRDVDTPEDLASALRLGVGRHTAAAAAALP